MQRAEQHAQQPLDDHRLDQVALELHGELAKRGAVLMVWVATGAVLRVLHRLREQRGMVVWWYGGMVVWWYGDGDGDGEMAMLVGSMRG